MLSVCFFLVCTFSLKAQKIHKVISLKALNTQSILLVNPVGNKTDSTQFQIPKYRQGFFCNFEDQLNRKKVPIDFSLGNSKY